ncbi:MAG: phage holin family protein [Bacteroidetes bacterium]|nr:phage holin family protein [Bacteroidota bacterium]
MDIKDSIFKFFRIDNLVNSLSGYVETRVELLKLELREEVARVVSHGLMLVVLFLLGLLFLVFFSFGLANYFNKFFNDQYAGYWIVSAIYLLLFLVLISFRSKIVRYFENHLIEQIKRKQK